MLRELLTHGIHRALVLLLALLLRRLLWLFLPTLQLASQLLDLLPELLDLGRKGRLALDYFTGRLVVAVSRDLLDELDELRVIPLPVRRGRDNRWTVIALGLFEPVVELCLTLNHSPSALTKRLGLFSKGDPLGVRDFEERLRLANGGRNLLRVAALERLRDRVDCGLRALVLRSLCLRLRTFLVFALGFFGLFRFLGFLGLFRFLGFFGLFRVLGPLLLCEVLAPKVLDYLGVFVNRGGRNRRRIARLRCCILCDGRRGCPCVAGTRAVYCHAW